MDALVTLTIVVLGELRGKILTGEDSKEKEILHISEIIQHLSFVPG